MNNAVVSGIVTTDVRLSNGNYGCYCNFTLSSLNGDKKVFIPVVAYSDIAEKLSRIKVGSKLALNGVLDTYKVNDEYKLGLRVKDFEVLTGEIISTLEHKEYWN